MNKQQLAAKIWESADNLRSKIAANEYKDYMLGFIFYKFLSEKETQYLFDLGYTEDDIYTVTEEDREIVDNVRKNIGYFISYDSLFSTWIEKGKDFDISDVRDALSAFNRLINPSHKKVFEKIFETLETGLSKFGETASTQTKAVRKLIRLINRIPMDGRQEYDVLGFIYEYLLSNFAANSGKAGEFYTPHEVSMFMSEIVANHLEDKTEIKIYDSTSGSGSLLINIGKAVAKRVGDSDRIKYYAQELLPNAFNLTRMNLIMRDVLPDNIEVRNADTLEEDWPYFDESDPIGTYEPLFVDAVVSNPPYSQKWDPKNKESDPRYKRYGLAPKTKAESAFLLHDLYHLKSDGIMTIVLPHGVLFRNEEETIRKNLVENNNIDAIIGLPPNIFFGTTISTIVMVLRQRRERDDVLIVDASKGFIKDGKKNRLRASDIKRIVDTVTKRLDIDKYSRTVSRKEIRENNYILNIPRYIDSSEKPESWDIYATMFGGIPAKEINEYEEYWKALPELNNSLFIYENENYANFRTEDIRQLINTHGSVKKYKEEYAKAFDGFDNYLYQELLKNPEGVSVLKEESVLSDDIFSRLDGISLVNAYDAYQILDDLWKTIGIDLEVIQMEGFEATKKVDPNMVPKTTDEEEELVQDGWVGRILPFELVQKQMLSDKGREVQKIEDRLNEISSEYEVLIETLSEEEKQRVLNDDNTAFVQKTVKQEIKDILEEAETEDTQKLKEYQLLKKAKEKLSFIENHPELPWARMKENRNGTYSVTKTIIFELKKEIPFEANSYEDILLRTSRLMDEEKLKKKQLKMQKEELEIITKETIEGLSDEQAVDLLEMKWITPLTDALLSLPNKIIKDFAAKMEALANKYKTTFSEVEEQIQKTENELSNMIEMLVGDAYDMEGLAELKKLLGD